MKRNILLLLAYILPVAAASAAPVKLETAYRCAKCFLCGTETRSEDVTLVWTGGTGTRSTSVPALYVFNKGDESFVIISGDDSMRPILAYSKDNAFCADDMPDHVSWWMNGICETVLSARSKNESNESVRDEWNALQSGDLPSAGPVVELGTVCWDQSDPYNAKCPSGCATGCTATAAAEIMAYYGWPEKGIGTLPDYYDGVQHKTQQGHELTTEYMWDDIRQLTTTSKARNASDEVRENLSQLLWDVGVMLKSDYGRQTSANPENVHYLMSRYMSWNEGAVMHQAHAYTLDEWKAKLRAELDASRPLFYAGFTTTDSGHAFVVDGYDKESYFHVNWGWSGSNNGYYAIDALYMYTDHQCAIFNFTPSYQSGKENHYELELESTSRYYGVGFVNKFTEKNKRFKMSLGTIYCLIQEDYSTNVWMSLVDRNGNIKQENIFTKDQILVFNKEKDSHNIILSSIDCMITVDTEFGDRIVPYYTGYNGKMEFKSSDDGSIVKSMPLYPAPFLDIKDSYRIGEKIVFKIKNTDIPYKPYYTVSQYKTVWEVLQNGESILSFDNSVSDIECFIPQTQGKYTISATIYDISSGEIYDEIATDINCTE